MIIGKFQQENGVYVGQVQTFTGGSLAIRIAPTDLKGIDLGWIRRTKTIQLALSRELFQHSPSLSMLLEEGSG